MRIKFSHHYCKMPPDYKVSRLTGIQIEDIKLLAPEFLDQDSRISTGGNYPLPKSGLVMILWLESSIMNIRWQTIRRWSSSKEEYYRKYVGKLVDCCVCPKCREAKEHQEALDYYRKDRPAPELFPEKTGKEEGEK